MKPAENLPKQKKKRTNTNKQTNNGDIEVIHKVALYVGLGSTLKSLFPTQLGYDNLGSVSALTKRIKKKEKKTK